MHAEGHLLVKLVCLCPQHFNCKGAHPLFEGAD